MKRNVFPLQKLLFEKQKQPGARNPEGAVPILGLCHGVFTDQFIFRHILGHFFFFNNNRPWNVPGPHSEAETRTGFICVYLVGSRSDVIDCGVELH